MAPDPGTARTSYHDVFAMINAACDKIIERYGTQHSTAKASERTYRFINYIDQLTIHNLLLTTYG